MADEATSPGSPGGEWSQLFHAAFVQSRNPMTLLDGERRHVDVNGAYLRLLGYRRAQLIGRPVYEIVAGGPLATRAEWNEALARGHFTGSAELIASDGRRVGVQWAATTEEVTSGRLVLFVAVTTERWGRNFRRQPRPLDRAAALTAREQQVVRLVALGATGPEIAEELQIAPDTVRVHARNAMEKVGARSRAHLVARAFSTGLVTASGRVTR
jgi:PAS domain S-box-containing protein